jgi:adenylyltransferase/sulfurtransferase
VGACYECTFTEATYARFNRRYSCPYGFLNRQVDGALPTTAVTASLAAALQVQEAVAFLHGRESGLKPGQRLTVHLNPYHLVVDQLPANPDCLAHDPLPASIAVLEVDWQATPLAEAIRRARAWLPGAHTLELPYELVAWFACPSCGNRARVLRPKGKIYHDEALCPACGTLRHPELISAIPLSSPLAGCSPGNLGLPDGEILSFLSDEGRAYIELKDGRN